MRYLFCVILFCSFVIASKFPVAVQEVTPDRHGAIVQSVVPVTFEFSSDTDTGLKPHEMMYCLAHARVKSKDHPEIIEDWDLECTNSSNQKLKLKLKRVTFHTTND